MRTFNKCDFNAASSLQVVFFNQKRAHNTSVLSAQKQINDTRSKTKAIESTLGIEAVRFSVH